MPNITGVMTQVFIQSPQVTALVATDAALAAQVKHQGQAEESRRLKEKARAEVLGAERPARAKKRGGGAGEPVIDTVA